MEKADYNFNEDSDEQKLAEAIEDVNQRIDTFEREQAQENDEEQEEQGIKWPSISDRF